MKMEKVKTVSLVNLLAVTLVTLAAIVLVWESFPLAQRLDVLYLDPPVQLPEQRKIEITWQPVTRPGEINHIFLNLVPGSPQEMDGVTHSKLLVEARMDIQGMTVSPMGAVSQPLVKGQVIKFVWQVTPQLSGKYQGTLWLFLRVVSDQGGEDARLPMLAYPLEITTRNIFGINPKTLRVLCLLSGLIGILVLFSNGIKARHAA